MFWRSSRRLSSGLCSPLHFTRGNAPQPSTTHFGDCDRASPPSTNSASPWALADSCEENSFDDDGGA